MSDNWMTALVLLISFADTLALGLLNPITPKLLRTATLGATMYTALESVSNAAALASGTVLGRISDLSGRKCAIVVSATIGLAGYLCYVPGLDTSSNMAWVALAKVLTTVSRAGLIAPLNTLLTDGQQTAEASRRRVGRLMGVIGLGFCAGSGLGGYLSQQGAAVPLLCACACAGVEVACALLLPSRPAVGSPRNPTSMGWERTPMTNATVSPPARRASEVGGRASGDGGGRSSWLTAVREAGLQRPTLLLLGLQLARSVSMDIYSATSKLYHTDALGYNIAQLGYISSFAGWAYAAQTLFVLPRCLKVATPVPLLIVAFFCTAAGRCGLAAASLLPPTPMILGSYVVLNLGQGMTSTLLKALMGGVAEPHRRGLQLGLLSTTEKVAGIIGPLIAGPLYTSRFGPAAPAWAAALVAAAGGCATLACASELRSLRSVEEPKGKKDA